jgi:hypothetical protein
LNATTLGRTTITGLHPACTEECGRFPSSPALPFPTSSYSRFSLRRLLSVFIGRSVRIRQCLRSFYHPCPFFCPLFLVCCGPGKKLKIKKKNGTLCIVVFGHLLLASFSSPSSCLISISRLRHSSPRRGPPPPKSRPPQVQPILSLGVAPRPAIDSDRAIPSWANGRLHPKIKRSSRLLLGFARVGRTDVGPLSGPRSSRRARDLIMCPCTSDVGSFSFP